jgi:hypothetical protein
MAITSGLRTSKPLHDGHFTEGQEPVASLARFDQTGWEKDGVCAHHPAHRGETVMDKTVVALGLAGVLLAWGSSTASAASIVPPAKSVIGSLNSDLTDVRWRRCWSPGPMRIAHFGPARHMYGSDQPTRDLLWLWFDP